MVSKVPLNRYHRSKWTGSPSWPDLMVEMVRAHIRGEKIFVEFDGSTDARRTGSVGRLILSDDFIQNVVHGGYASGRSWGQPSSRTWKEPREEDVKLAAVQTVLMDGWVRWDGRSNRVSAGNGWGMSWLRNYDETQGTQWIWEKPEGPPAVVAKDKLGREIQKGDFISYILYHFDNKRNAAGIYYGKVSKIDRDGTVWARNIKLSETDKVDEKKIKDNSLVVIMSKDLMDKLMLARLSIL